MIEDQVPKHIFQACAAIATPVGRYGLMPEQEHWQLDGSAPELYECYLVPAITSGWATDLVGRASPQPGDRVLDIACGTGAVTRLAAERVTTGRKMRA